MSTTIPATGDHTFAIAAQNLSQLNRLLTTKLVAPTLALRIGTTFVTFSWVRVLAIRPVTSAPGQQIISVRLSYKAARVASGPSVAPSALNQAASFPTPRTGGLPDVFRQPASALDFQQQIAQLELTSRMTMQERLTQSQQLSAQITQTMQAIHSTSVDMARNILDNLRA